MRLWHLAVPIIAGEIPAAEITTDMTRPVG